MPTVESYVLSHQGGGEIWHVVNFNKKVVHSQLVTQAGTNSVNEIRHVLQVKHTSDGSFSSFLKALVASSRLLLNFVES